VITITITIDEATHNFRYFLYEIELEADINIEKGECGALRLK